MTDRSRSPRFRRLSHRRHRAGAIYIEVLVAIIPVLIFFLGLLQLGLTYTARLVVRHAASRAARSAVVVLEDAPEKFGDTPQGEVTYRDTSGASGGSTEQFLQGVASLLKVDLPISDVRRMLTSESGPRLAAIQRAAYMPLATLAPPPEYLLETFGIDGDPLGPSSNLTRFLVGLLLYNRAAAMVTLRKPDGSVANCVGPTDDVTVRVTYLYTCTMPIVSTFMCDSLMELSGLDQLEDATRNYYESLSRDGIQGARAATDELQSDLQRVSDDVGSLSRDLQYAASPELILPFLFSRAHFKLVSAESTLPNQGANYYAREPCRPPTPEP